MIQARLSTYSAVQLFTLLPVLKEQILELQKIKSKWSGWKTADDLTVTSARQEERRKHTATEQTHMEYRERWDGAGCSRGQWWDSDLRYEYRDRSDEWAGFSDIHNRKLLSYQGMDCLALPAPPLSSFSWLLFLEFSKVCF